MVRAFFVLLLSSLATAAFTQSRPVRYVSVSSDNDYYYWFGYSNDRYYTAGNSLTYGFGASTKNKLVRVLLPSLSDSASSIFSVRLFQQLNTPTYLSTYHLQSSDYPFAASLYVTVARNTVSPVGLTRWKTEFDIGVLGPAAEGEQSQEFFHRLSHSQPPTNWSYQMPNQLILNYHTELEKNIFSRTSHSFVNSLVHASVGTMNTFLQAGISGSTSNQKNLVWSDFSLWPKQKRWTVFASVTPALRWVIWNEMLEGMPFQNHTTFYKVASSEITRLLPMFVLKVAVARGRHFLMGMQTFTGREFHTVDPQVYGTITYLYRLD